jgi:hypothetical protein
MLEQFETHRQILFDLTANYLEPLNSAYQRLAYLFALRDPASGKYVHENLANVYGADAVHQVLFRCHEEVFERLLEMPLHAQKADLHAYLSSLAGSQHAKVVDHLEISKNWVPLQAPTYLKELFRSNLNALVELLRDHTSTAPPKS